MDARISSFLQDLELVSPTHARIVHEVRKIYSGCSQQITERHIYGGIGFFVNGKLVGGAYPYKNHVSVVFSRGNELQEQESQLEGRGTYRRHLKISEISDLSAKKASYFIRQVVELEMEQPAQDRLENPETK